MKDAVPEGDRAKAEMANPASTCTGRAPAPQPSLGGPPPTLTAPHHCNLSWGFRKAAVLRSEDWGFLSSR